MLEEGLINHPVVGFGESGRKANEFRNLLKKIEESEVCTFLNYYRQYSAFCVSHAVSIYINCIL